MQEEKASAKATVEGSPAVAASGDESVQGPGVPPNLFEEIFGELKKWVDVKSSKYATLLVIREKRCGRLGTALKVLCLVALPNHARSLICSFFPVEMLLILL